MSTKMTFVTTCAIILYMGAAEIVQGRPSFATTHNNNCADCHTTKVTGRMEVTAQDSLTDLGTQLDGNVRGPLKTFQVVQGQVVTLSVRVLDGNDRFAVQLKNFEKSDRQYNGNNLLNWSAANNVDNIWTRQQVSNPPYFTKDNGSNGGISGSVSPITYTFDVQVEPNTPVDFYELVFAVPGLRNGVRVYQEEHFYLEVLSPYDFTGDGIVDCADVCMLVEHLQSGEPRYDIAPPPLGDGLVDAQDLVLLSENLYKDYRLVAHWALDETEGDIARDSAGENFGVVVGGAVWLPTEGQVKGALQFDGSDDAVVTGPVLDPAKGPLSIFAWVKGGAPGQVILAQLNGANWLGADPDLGCLMTELMSPSVGRFIPKPLKSEYVITDGQWHRIGFVWDGAKRALYVDDILVAEDTQNTLSSSLGGLNIGCGSNSEVGTFWSGLIDDVRIYNQAVMP
jgi:hypothetical protein